MAQWKANDNASNSVSWVAESFKANNSSANKTKLYANTTEDFIPGLKLGVYGVSNDELQAERAARAPSPAHSGWVLRKEGTGGRAGRVHYETLVAMSSIVGDGENAVFQNYFINILTQPESSNLNVNSAFSLSVSAVSVPAGGTLTYEWQRAGSNGVFLPIANTGLFSGNQSSTLSISNNATLNANTFRVMLAVSGAANTTIYSANADIKTY
jgi:hypothetical protein